MSVTSIKSESINFSRNIYTGDNKKSAIGKAISGIGNKITHISAPRINTPNTQADKISIKLEVLKSSITNISSFKAQSFGLSKEGITSFLEPNSDKVTTSRQSKLQNINRAIKVEIPKISDEQMANFSNKKKEDEPISSQVKIDSDNNKNNIGYKKIQDRYELNSNKFSDVFNIIKNEKISNQEKESKLKSYLSSNDLSMKNIGKFERFKNIFGMSKKINTIQNEQRDHAIVILANLNKTIADGK